MGSYFTQLSARSTRYPSSPRNLPFISLFSPVPSLFRSILSFKTTRNPPGRHHARIRHQHRSLHSRLSFRLKIPFPSLPFLLPLSPSSDTVNARRIKPGRCSKIELSYRQSTRPSSSLFLPSFLFWKHPFPNIPRVPSITLLSTVFL